MSSPAPRFKNINSLALSQLYGPTLSSVPDYWETIALTRWSFVGKAMSLLFNMLSRLVTAFFPRREPFFNFMTTVTFHSDFGAQENKICQFPFVLHILL